MENRLVGGIYPSKVKISGTIIGSVLLIAMAFVIVVYQQQIAPSIAILICSYTGIAFFGLIFLYSLYRLIVTKPVIIIDKKGITDNASLLGVGLIKWEEIDTIGINRFLSQNYIGIIPKNASAILARQNIFKRLFLNINKRLTSMPVNIPENFLPMTAPQLLLRIKEFQTQNNKQYILTENIRQIPRKSKGVPKLIAACIPICFIMALVITGLFANSKKSFALHSALGEGFITYSCLNLGGYSFVLDDHWANKTNKTISRLIKGEFRNDNYFVVKGKPWELWISVDKNNSRSAAQAGNLAKQRILKELSFKKIQIAKSLDEKVNIAGTPSTLSSIFLKNGQILSIIAVQRGALSVVGFLAYDSQHMQLIKDLADMLISFKTLSSGK